MTSIAGVVLAGGLSSRMGGGDKSLISLGGTTLLARAISRLTPQVSSVVLNANGDLARFTAFEQPIVSDSIDGFAGPLAGVLAGLDWAADHGIDQVVSVAADTPFFPANLVQNLVAAADQQRQPIALAATPHRAKGFARQPTFGLWPTRLRENLRQSLAGGLRKIVVWTDMHGTAVAEFATSPYDPFFNVNTPEDVQEALSMIAEFRL